MRNSMSASSAVRTTTLVLLTGVIGGAACGSTTGVAGTGGAQASGGVGSGGTGIGSGGATASGGVAGTGGVTGSGGMSGTGGAGNATSSGGSGAASGGRVGTGGISGTGGSAGAPGGGSGAPGGGSGATGGAGTSSGAELWIAPDGLDTSAGTEAQPWKTLTMAHTRVSAGGTIWVKPGTYAIAATVQLTKSGTATAPIKVFAAAGARPLFNFSQQTKGDSSARGVQIKGDYWHLKGIEIANAGDNCIHISGSHNTVEAMLIHECGDTGIQITVDSSLAGDATRGAYNTILNCDSYGNYDGPTGGENADGFAAKLYIGPGNVFRGCRAWNNADDGWDFFASDDVVVLDNCWAFSNGKTLNGQSNTNGDGNGFKLGGAATAGDANMGGAVHQVTRCFAFENAACGFVRNNNTSVPVLSMCGGRADTKGEFCSLTNSAPVTFTMTAAEAKTAPRNADGSLPAIH